MWTARALFLLLILYTSLDYVQPEHVKTDHPWDLLIFTQQWPITVCKEWKKSNPDHTCTLPTNQDSWTIHGVWPTKLHTVGPAFCNKSWHFDPEQVKPIESSLIQYWTNIEGEPKTYGLWSHEWSKHGTCAAVLEPLNSEFKYFSNGLHWMQNYSMSNILGSSITPSNENEYHIGDIYTAVTGKLHVNPAIECRKLDGKSWLVEIRICFDKSLHLVDCDGIVGFRHQQVTYYDMIITDILTNCDVNESILYPRDMEITVTPKVSEVEMAPPKKWIVQLYKLSSWLQWFTL